MARGIAEIEMVQWVTVAAEDFLKLENKATDGEILSPLFKRLTDLVEENPKFFGNPIAGVHPAVQAIDKLEDLVEVYNSKTSKK